MGLVSSHDESCRLGNGSIVRVFTAHRSNVELKDTLATFSPLAFAKTIEARTARDVYRVFAFFASIDYIVLAMAMCT